MLKIAVFGTGHLGKFHLNNWKEIEGVKIVGFFDPNNDNANDVINKHGLKRFSDEEKLIEVAKALGVTAEAIKNFSEEAVLSNIYRKIETELS